MKKILIMSLFVIGILAMTGFANQTQTESSSQVEKAAPERYNLYYTHIITPVEQDLYVGVRIICGSLINQIYPITGTGTIPFTLDTGTECSVEIILVPVGWVLESGGGKKDFTIGNEDMYFNHIIRLIDSEF